MSNIKEYVEEPECPCYKCILLALCKNKELEVMMKECTLLYKYLYKEQKCKSLCLDIVNLYQFCEILGIQIDRKDGSYAIKYSWQR